MATALLATVLLTLPHAADSEAASTVTIEVTGAGTVTPTSPSGLPTCTSQLSTPTGVVGNSCSFSTEGAPFATFGRAVSLRADVPSGWEFDRWTTPGTASSPCFVGAQTDATCLTTVGSCGPSCTFFDRSIRAAFVDVSPPATAIDLGPSGTVVDVEGRASFTFHSADPSVARFECALDSPSFEPCASPHGLSRLSDGFHHFEVRAVDPSGLADLSPASRDWDEETPPDTQITTGPPEGALVADRRATLTLASSKPSSTFTCALDGSAWTPCSTPTVLAGLSDGVHRFAARATDGRGNTDPTPASRTWTVDTTPPETRIVTGPEEGLLTNSRSASFILDSEPGARFECALDGSAFGACSALVTLANLSLGGHAVAGRALDAAGNADPTPAGRTWSITADLDRDGFILPGDCDDNNATVHPGARESPQDGVDQDCSGHDARFPALGSRVRIAVGFLAAATRITSLTLENLPEGTKIRVSCRDRKHSCPFDRRTMQNRRAKRRIALTRLFHNAALRQGAVVEVRITKAATLGLVTRLRMRNGRVPSRSEHCLDPRDSRRVAC
jgi:Putative metal-binding motif